MAILKENESQMRSNHRFYNSLKVFEVVKDENGYGMLMKVDKDTIKPKTSNDGFVQVIQGRVVAEFTKDEIVYLP